MVPTVMTIVTEFRQLFLRSLQGWEGLIEHGGAVSIVLVAFAIVGLAIIIEKSFALRQSVIYNADYDDVLLAVKRGNDDQIEYELNLFPEIQSDLVRSAHEARDLEKDDILRELTAVANTHVRRMSARLELLGNLGKLAPLLGLLGTVIGIMRSLTQVTFSGGVDRMILGQGLMEALLTTAVGLIVGIPMIFFHNLFRARINRFAEQFEEFGYDLVRSIIYPASVEFGDRDASKVEDESTETQPQESPTSEGEERTGQSPGEPNER